MKTLFPKSLLTIIGLIVYSFLAVGTSMCGNDEELSSAAEDRLEFIGRVQDQAGKPKNNRLVIVYLNGKEVGRSKTHLGKYDEIEEVPNDGLFFVNVPNSYELSEKELANPDLPIGSKGRLSSASDFKFGSITYLNFKTIVEGDDRVMWVNSRDNVKYTLKILPGEFETLPFDIQDERNKTVLTKSGKVVVVSNQGIPKTEIKDVVFKSKKEEVKLKEIDFPLNNCSGNSEIRQKYNKSESYLHETNFNIGMNAKGRAPALWLLGIDLTAYFETKYGFTEKEFSSETIEYEFKAKPRTNINYKIIWYEVWEHGEAKVVSDDGVISVPFKVKTSLKYEIKTERKSCK